MRDILLWYMYIKHLQSYFVYTMWACLFYSHEFQKSLYLYGYDNNKYSTLNLVSCLDHLWLSFGYKLHSEMRMGIKVGEDAKER